MATGNYTNVRIGRWVVRVARVQQRVVVTYLSICVKPPVTEAKVRRGADGGGVGEMPGVAVGNGVEEMFGVAAGCCVTAGDPTIAVSVTFNE